MFAHKLLEPVFLLQLLGVSLFSDYQKLDCVDKIHRLLRKLVPHAVLELKNSRSQRTWCFHLSGNLTRSILDIFHESVTFFLKLKNLQFQVLHISFDQVDLLLYVIDGVKTLHDVAHEFFGSVIHVLHSLVDGLILNENRLKNGLHFLHVFLFGIFVVKLNLSWFGGFEVHDGPLLLGHELLLILDGSNKL